MTVIATEVCIIGSGASGAVAAASLVQAGLDVCVLERGYPVTSETAYQWVVASAEQMTVRSGPCSNATGYPWSTCNLGGGTVFYGGASFRYRDVDFDPLDYIHVDDLVVNWPFMEKELRSCYDRIEQEIGVAGMHGLDPTEPPCGNTLLPPHPYSPRAEKIVEAAKQSGLHPFPTPLAINSTPYKGRPKCENSTNCIERYCHYGAKGDAVTVYWKPLSGAPNLRVMCGTKVVRLHLAASGKVSHAVAVDLESNAELKVEARVFMLAANAIQSAALLLQSRGPYAPQGLGNDYDMVGRGLCFKNSIYVQGRIPSIAHSVGLPGAELAGPFSTMSLTDYYLDDRCPIGLGGLIYEATPGLFPLDGWTQDTVRLECIIADHPSFENRVTIEHKLGEMVPVIHYTVDPRDQWRLSYLADRARELLESAGAINVELIYSGFDRGSTHLHGTCRAGTEPNSSVVDPGGRLHSVENVYVIDGGFMPFPGGVNPTLTIQANALRIAELILGEFLQ